MKAKYVLLSLFSVVAFSVQSEAGPTRRYVNIKNKVEARPCVEPPYKCDSWDRTCVVCPTNTGSNPDSSFENNGTESSSAGNSAAVAQAVSQCQSSMAEAQNDCDQDQDTGMQGAQTTLSNFAVQMGSQMGLQGACTGIGKVLGGANAAVAAFSQLCISAKNRCTAACNNAKTAVTSSGTQAIYQAAVEDSIHKCRALDGKIQQASQAIGNTLGTIQGAQACAKQTDTDLFDFCKSNPSALGCETAATDCSNPSIAASNPICICKANPSAATCTGANLKADAFGAGNYDSASLNAGAAAGANGSIDSSGILGDASWAGDPNLKADSSRAEDVGGSKGGRPLDEGGGGGGGGAGGSRAGGGTPAASVAVNSGFRSGGSGSGGWSNGGGGSWVGQDGQAKAGAQNGNAHPDLRQFLPGGKFDPKTRGLAGLSGPDGITGPHTDIWKKIQNRYQIKQPSLMP